MLQPYMLMQMPFRFKIRIHKWYLGQTAVVVYLFMLVFLFYIWSDCFSGPDKGKIEVQR